jgi:signal transduction histidine kinase
LSELAAEGEPLGDLEPARQALAQGTAQVGEIGSSPSVALPLVHRERPLGVLGLRFSGAMPSDLRHLRPLTARAGTVLAAAEREARKGRFLAFAAHELKTPLTSIKGFAYSLAKRLELGEPIDPKSVGILERQSERLHLLLEELLEVSRIDTGRFVLHPEPCDVGELIASANRVLKRLGSEATIATPEGASQRLRVDRDRVERSLVALALHAHHLGAPLLAELSADGQRMLLRLCWTGPALGAHERESAFEPRWERGREKHQPGLGMGLSLARRVARLHGGELEAEAGCFALSLPLRAPPRRADGSAPRVLVVDDDQPMAAMLVELLAEHGYAARAAFGGQAALEQLERGPAPDLIVLDLRMPDLDGRAMLREARARLGLSPKVVLLSADRDVKAAARELCATAFVEKPFKPEALLAAVARALEP